jgi:glycosyltransferase involved in cell wall biosynthesis
MMRIAVFHNRYRERGGEDAAVDAQVELLVKAGHEVRFCCVDNREEIQGITGALRAGRFARWNPATEARVAGWLDGFEADVAHVHNFFPLLSPSLHHALAERGIPVVQTLHNYRLVCANALLLREGAPCRECVDRGPWRALRYGCYRDSRVQTAVWSDLTAYHRRRGTWRDCVTRFVAPSEAARRELVAAGLSDAHTLVIPNPVADPGAPAPPGEGGVYVGRLSREKGLDLLLDAWQRLAGTPLWIVGGGPEEARLRARAAALPNVRFLGEVSRDRALAAFAGAAFAVVPSLALEVFGMTTLEAMASGRPAVVPRGSAMAELVDPGRTGLAFESGDVASLADACRALAQDPAAAAALGEEARRDYEDLFAPDVVLAALEGLYGSIRR